MKCGQHAAYPKFEKLALFRPLQWWRLKWKDKSYCWSLPPPKKKITPPPFLFPVTDSSMRMLTWLIFSRKWQQNMWNQPLPPKVEIRVTSFSWQTRLGVSSKSSTPFEDRVRISCLLCVWRRIPKTIRHGFGDSTTTMHGGRVHWKVFSEGHSIPIETESRRYVLLNLVIIGSDNGLSPIRCRPII